MKIVNLTMHQATAEQVEVGVFDLTERDSVEVKELLNFVELPTPEEIHKRAVKIAHLAALYCPDAAMIGGAVYLMPELARMLKASGIQPLAAFSIRESVEVQNPDGSVTKTAVFKHRGFVDMTPQGMVFADVNPWN